MFTIPAANEDKRRQQAPIGSERAARLAAMERRGHGHIIAPQNNLTHNLSFGGYWTNSGGGETPEPTRMLAAIGSERAARLAAVENLDLRQMSAARQLQSSMPSLPLRGDDEDLSFCLNSAALWACTSVLPGWQEVFQEERVPHPDRNPLPTPTPSPTPTSTPEGLYLLFDKTPVKFDSTWLTMLPGWKGKGELPLPLYDEQVLDDLRCAQARNHRLIERILNQMPDEQRRQQLQCELLRLQLRSEQQLTIFLEGMLSQGAPEPEPKPESEPQCLWMSWFGNEEDTEIAGGEGHKLPEPLP